MTQHVPRLAACPTCEKMSPWSTENPWRPFCSERCKTIDLGAWATESYRLPEKSESLDPDTPEESNDFE